MEETVTGGEITLSDYVFESGRAFFFNNEGLGGSPPEDTGKHESIAWTVGIQTGVDKGQSSRQLSVCKRIEGVSSRFKKKDGGGESHTGWEITWETSCCATFCKPLQQQADIVALSRCEGSATKNVAVIDLLPAQYLLHPWLFSFIVHHCLVGRRAWFLSTALLKMLHSLAFHVPLPKSPLPAFNPGIFEYFMVQSQGWARVQRDYSG